MLKYTACFLDNVNFVGMDVLAKYKPNETSNTEKIEVKMRLNDIKVIGNLVKAPEVRYTPGGTAVSNVHIGINERYTVDNTVKEITTFTEVQVWGPAAENLSKMAKKGQEILVEGSLRQDTWEDKTTGDARSKLYINAERWQFTQRKEAPAIKEERPAPAVR